MHCSAVENFILIIACAIFQVEAMAALHPHPPSQVLPLILALHLKDSCMVVMARVVFLSHSEVDAEESAAHHDEVLESA